MPDNEELDDQSLFNDAVSDEPAETTVTEQPAEVVTEPVAEGQPRDETGKFAKAEEPETQAEAEQQPAADGKPGYVPAFRVREEAEARRRAESDLAQERADKALLRQRLEALERPTQKVEPVKEAKPDPLLDPEGYERYLETKFEERLLNDRRELSLATAHKTHGKEFEEAYAAAQKQVDPVLKARMQASRDPGETLIQWHRELKTQAEIGGDLNAYKERLRQEALKDPEFRKKAMETWRDEAPTQANGRPRVDLPPSLNGASRSNALLRSTNVDVPDPELWNEITAQ